MLKQAQPEGLQKQAQADSVYKRAKNNHRKKSGVLRVFDMQKKPERHAGKYRCEGYGRIKTIRGQKSAQHIGKTSGGTSPYRPVKYSAKRNRDKADPDSQNRSAD